MITLDEFLTSADLVPGQVVNIYEDSKYEVEPKIFEGAAVLVERKSKGFTYMINDEPMFTKLEDRAINHNTGAHYPLSKEQRESNKKYLKLQRLLTGYKRSGVHHYNNDLYNLYLYLKDKVNKNLDNPKLLNRILNRFRVLWNDYKGERAELFKFYSNIDIIRFIQQTCLPDWCHTIWREEHWVVDFFEQSDVVSEKLLYHNTFRTIRKIRTLVCVCPNKQGQTSDIIKYVTKGNSTYSTLDKDDIEVVDYDDEDYVEDEIEETDDYDEDYEELEDTKGTRLRFVSLDDIDEPEDEDEEW